MSVGIRVRPYQSTDESDLIALWNASLWADPVDALGWRSRYLLDPNFTPALCLIATIEGTPVGFVLGMASASSPGPDAWVVAFGVDSAHRRRGIARLLFKRLEASLIARGIERMLIGPYIPSYVAPGVDEAAYPEAIAFLHAIGANTLDHPLSMKASLTGYRPSPKSVATTRRLAAEGIRIRPAEPSDIVPLLEFLREHFPHWRVDAIGLMAELFGTDPRDVTLHIAVEDGDIVGYAQSRAERFGPFGVNESCRGRGIGAALLAHVLPAMRARDFHSAWFLWSNDRAARLYREHGFEEVRRFALTERRFSK